MAPCGYRGSRRYFDSIPHADLMKSVARRVAIGTWHLIKDVAAVPVEEHRRGCKKRTTRIVTREARYPTGSPLLPLLANLYMRRSCWGGNGGF